MNSCFASGLFKGKRVLVTGAGRGIGQACARAFAALDADVALLSRNQANLDGLQKSLLARGNSGQIVSLCCDVADFEALEHCLKSLKESFGPVDILVNNAGIYMTEPVAGHDMAVWQRTIDTNLTSVMLASSILVKDMVAQNWGRVINISSISGKSGEAWGAAYSASKFALIGLTQSLALEVADKGVTVNAVCPGWVATDMAHEQITDPRWCDLNNLEPEFSLDAAKFSVPQQRLIEAAEVADLVLYLASDAARGMTGQAINICGGLSIHS